MSLVSGQGDLKCNFWRYKPLCRFLASVAFVRNTKHGDGVRENANSWHDDRMIKISHWSKLIWALPVSRKHAEPSKQTTQTVSEITSWRDPTRRIQGVRQTPEQVTSVDLSAYVEKRNWRPLKITIRRHLTQCTQMWNFSSRPAERRSIYFTSRLHVKFSYTEK